MSLWSHRFFQNCQDFCPVYCRAEILTIFCSYFGRNDDFINSFWNLLIFTMLPFDQKRKPWVNNNINNFNKSGKKNCPCRILICHYIISQCTKLQLHSAKRWKVQVFSAATLLQLLDFQVQMRKVSKLFNSLSPSVH